MTLIIYQTDHTGRFVGQAVADESPLEPGVHLIPAGCTITAPPDVAAGFVARLVDGVWTVEAAPPVAQAPSPISIETDRRAEIMEQLAAIDAASARPMRAILNNCATQADRDRLAELDSQAAELRLELAALA